MKRWMIALALILSLLSLTAVGTNGCGKKNTITSISVTPAAPFIVKDTALQLAVTAYFSDGMSLSSWTQVTWQSSDPEVATVSGAGLVTAGTATTGTVLITAIDKAHPEITASVTATIADLTSIEIKPLSAIISAGTSTQFTATGHYLAGTLPGPSDLTELVSWASSSTDIAVISNVTGSKGIATAGTTTGTTTITAKVLATSITGTPITGTETLIVVP